jgi:hypothetical protein
VAPTCGALALFREGPETGCGYESRGLEHSVQWENSLWLKMRKERFSVRSLTKYSGKWRKKSCCFSGLQIMYQTASISVLNLKRLLRVL